MYIEQAKQKVQKPTFRDPGCWVVIRVPSANRSFAKTYVRCSKRVRTDSLTCAAHARWEDEARELQARHHERERK